MGVMHERVTVIPFDRQVKRLQEQVEQLQIDNTELIEENTRLKSQLRGLRHRYTGVCKEAVKVLRYLVVYHTTTARKLAPVTARLKRLVKY